MFFQQELKRMARLQLWHFVLHYAGIIFNIIVTKVKSELLPVTCHEVPERGVEVKALASL
jgi:predicted acetyltransferase